MAALDELRILNREIGRSVSEQEMLGLAIHCSDSEVLVALAHVSNVVIDGSPMMAFPTPVGLLETRPDPVVLLSTKYLRIGLFGTRRGPLGLPEEILNRWSVGSITRIEKVGRRLYRLTTSPSSKIELKMSFRSTFKNRRGIAHLAAQLQELVDPE